MKSESVPQPFALIRTHCTADVIVTQRKASHVVAANAIRSAGYVEPKKACTVVEREDVEYVCGIAHCWALAKGDYRSRGLTNDLELPANRLTRLQLNRGTRLDRALTGVKYDQVAGIIRCGRNDAGNIRSHPINNGHSIDSLVGLGEQSTFIGPATSIGDNVIITYDRVQHAALQAIHGP